MLTLPGTVFRPPAAAACRHPQARSATLGCRALLQPSAGTLTAIKTNGLVPKAPASSAHGNVRPPPWVGRREVDARQGNAATAPIAIARLLRRFVRGGLMRS